MKETDGILVVDKPSGMTSHDVVDVIRAAFHIKKVGHAGTLDPMATGVLVMLLGKFTRMSALLSGEDKEYAATMVLGAVSDTGDRDGKITCSAHPLDYSIADIEKVFSAFQGEISQTPPMYSAVKYKGKKMYEYARRGIEVKREARKILIKSLKITDFKTPAVAFEVACSKGTYIRQLCADIGAMLGCGAYLDSLRRTRSGDFYLRDAVQLDRLRAMPPSELEKAFIKI